MPSCPALKVYSEMPNYEVIVPALLKYGLQHLHEHASLTAGIPVIFSIRCAHLKCSHGLSTH